MMVITRNGGLLGTGGLLVLALAGCAEDASDAGASGVDATTGTTTPGTVTSDTLTTGDTSTGGIDAATAPDPQAPPEESGAEPVGPAVDAGTTTFFFSYDESASTAAPDLSLFALDAGLRPAARLGRPYEFLNAESFAPFDARPLGDFIASMTLRRAAPFDVPLPQEVEGTLYALGVGLEGPRLPRAERPNVVLTVLVDVSGSMDTPYASETRSDVRSLLDVAKHGLARIGPSLKDGDVLSLVTFSTSADVILEGVDATSGAFRDAVATLSTESSTDIGRGVDLAYEIANRTYDPDKANRVLILTDAMVNTGELDPARIADATVIGGREGILFSGIGVGGAFDDRVLDTITETGKGTYGAMITPNDAERLFTSGFARFIAPAATDVRFSLTYPQELDQLRSFSEEASAVEAEVSTVNFSHDSDQFFLELFTGPDALDPDATIELGVGYTDAAGERRELAQARTVRELLDNRTEQLDAALAVTTLAELVAGRVDCGSVRASTLYQAPVQDATYALYRLNIDRFCDQVPPYRFVDYRRARRLASPSPTR